MSDLVSAFFVTKLTGNPDAPNEQDGYDLFVKDEKGNCIDGCGWSAVGSVPVKGVNTAVYRYTSSADVIKWMLSQTKRWGFVEEVVGTAEPVAEKPPEEGVIGAAGTAVLIGDVPPLAERVADLKAILVTAGCATADVMDWADDAKLKRNVLDIHAITDDQYKVAGGTLE